MKSAKPTEQPKSLAKPVMDLMDSIRNLVTKAHEAGKEEGRRELLEEQQSDIRYKAGLAYIDEQAKATSHKEEKNEPHKD